MALTKEKKHQVVDELEKLISGSKLTVVARYPGTHVKALQQLRIQSRDSGTVIRIAKNSLFKKALASNERFSNVDTTLLTGQLLYAFNNQDDVAPAQNLASFAKSETQIQFVGAITPEGQLLSALEVQVLSALPPKEQLKAQLVGTFAAPLGGFINVLAGNVRSVFNILNARVRQIE